MNKTAQDFLSEANAVVPSIDVSNAVSLINSGKAVVIDVRDGKEIDQSGTVKGALRIPRGMIEFVADPATDFYNEEISADKEVLVICGAGGMAALTGKTLVEMGYSNVRNLGGFSAWKDAGGPTES
jgi:rhodanese-related sulfurtransferase